MTLYYILYQSCTYIYQCQWEGHIDKKIWDGANNSFVEIDYFRLNIIGYYNYGMGGIGVSDQLRLQYRVEGCMHQNNCGGKFLCEALVWMQQMHMYFNSKIVSRWGGGLKGDSE